MASAPMTVVETEEFLKGLQPLMSDEKRADLVALVRANPEAGEIMPENGGVRKIPALLAGYRGSQQDTV
jgi:hypothetical protein